MLIMFNIPPFSHIETFNLLLDFNYLFFYFFFIAGWNDLKRRKSIGTAPRPKSYQKETSNKKPDEEGNNNAWRSWTIAFAENWRSKEFANAAFGASGKSVTFNFTTIFFTDTNTYTIISRTTATPDGIPKAHSSTSFGRNVPTWCAKRLSTSFSFFRTEFSRRIRLA